MALRNGKYYLFANWKMYLDYAESMELAQALKGHNSGWEQKIKMVVFPSNLALKPVVDILNASKVTVGAQNAYWVDKGGYTGEISTEMVEAVGAKYLLIGHSERRHIFHESNHDTKEKIEAALLTGLTPVLCVGEKAEEKRGGHTFAVVEAQLRAALEGVVWADGRELIVAYEPVWAIGTGEACDPGEAQKVHYFIQELLEKLVPGIIPTLLYGGSVRDVNVGEYLKEENIHGVLVGGASTKLDSWTAIVRAVGA